MASNEFLWKPVSESDGNLVVLTPNQYNGQIADVVIVTPNGEQISGNFAGNTHNGARGHFRFNQPGSAFPQGSYVMMTLDSGEAIGWGIQNPGGRNTGSLGSRYDSASALQSDVSSGNVGTNGSSVIETEGGFFAAQSDFGGLSVASINPMMTYVDPITRTGEVGAFNREQFEQNFGISANNAMDLVALEFEGMQEFFPQASALQQQGVAAENVFNQGQVAEANVFNRSQIPQANLFNQEQIASANQFNQQQRLEQLDTAMPGAADVINRQIERGATLAEGRFVSDAEDRAFEVASRNAAAEGTVARGFGDDSVFGRRASDLLSAEQRLQVSKQGESTLNTFLSLGSNLAFDQPIKQNPIMDQPLQFQPQQASTSQDIYGVPSTPASALAVQQQQLLNPLTTIDPSQAIQFDIGQNQFNAQLDFDAQRYNSEANYKADLERIYADLWNAQQEASALNQGVAVNRVTDAIETGQNTQTSTGIGNIGGIVTGIMNSLTGSDTETGDSGMGVIVDNVNDIITGALSGTDTSGSSSDMGTLANGITDIITSSISDAGEIASDGDILEDIGDFVLDAFGFGDKAGTSTAGDFASAVNVLDSVASAFGIDTSTGDENLDAAIKSGIQFLASGGTDPVAAVQTMIAGDSMLKDLLGGEANKPLGILARALVFGGLNPGLAIDAFKKVGEAFSSGKSEEQQERDRLRDLGEDHGMFFKPSEERADREGLKTDHHYMELADGSVYDVGLDGGHKINNYGVNVDGNLQRNSYDIDWSDPRARSTVEMLDPVAFMLYGNDAEKMMGHLWNGVTSNNDNMQETKNNVRYQVDQSGLDYESGKQLLERYKDTGTLSQDKYELFLNGWNKLMLAEGVI